MSAKIFDRIPKPKMLKMKTRKTSEEEMEDDHQAETMTLV